MPIDPNIAMGYRPPQFESPVNQMAAVMQLQGAQQANELNRQKMEEYTRAREMEGVRRNALAGVDINSPDSYNTVAQRLYNIGDLEGAKKILTDYADLQHKRAQTTKEQATAEKTGVETKVKRLELFRDYMPILAADPSNEAIEKFTTLAVQNGVMDFKVAKPAMDKLLALPPEQRSQKLMQTALTAKDSLEQHYIQQDLGGTKQIVALSKNNPAAAPRVVSEQQVTLDPYEQGRLNIERYKASKGDGGGSEAPKLKQGERWNKELGRVEAVPGSDLFVKQSEKHGKDFQALQGVDTKVDSAINKIDYILSDENKSGFNANFGGYTAYGTSRITGKGVDVRSNIESLKSDLKAAGLELMRSGGSIGQITQQEWPIIEGMIGALKPEMSEDEAKNQFTNIRTYMERIRNNAREAYDTEWGGSQYHKADKRPSSPPAAGNVPRTNSKGWLLHTDAKGNQAYVSPDGKSIEEVKK